MKLSCYIVEDLMPSYIENLTSKKTQQDLEEHLKECPTCKKLHFDMEQEIFQLDARKSEPVNNTSNKNDLLYLDKIRNSYNKRSVISLSFFVCIILLLLVITWNTIEHIHYSILLSYGILPLFILAGAILFYKTPSAETYTKKDFVIGQMLVFIFTGISTWTMYISDFYLKNESFPFGLKIHELGPFTASILCLSVVVASICFIYGGIQILNKSYIYYTLCTHALSLLFLNIGFYRLLKTLTDITQYKQLRAQNLGVYLLGVIITLCIGFVSTNKQRCSHRN